MPCLTTSCLALPPASHALACLPSCYNGFTQGPADIRKRLRAELMRWHTDKVSRVSCMGPCKHACMGAWHLDCPCRPASLLSHSRSIPPCKTWVSLHACG